jgi:pimeloyl-ACP methyl ester carboxylesterase
MRKFLRRALIGLVVLVLLTLVGTWAFGLKRHADAAPEALAAAVTDADVSYEAGRYLVLRPRRVPERMGVIVYPGAYVDARGYLKTLRPIAAAGYRVIVVPMPMEAAYLGVDRALDVQSANPDLRRWALVGHSLGGAMAGLFASRHVEALDGLVIWDSFPAGDLAQYPKPVWHIHRATPDGAPPALFAKRRALFPQSSHWVPIRGGVHLYFGSFSGGGYKEDWPPSISRDEEQRQVVAATLQALADIERSAAGSAAITSR